VDLPGVGVDATVRVPLVGCVPPHAPLAVQDVTPSAVQVSVALCPMAIWEGEMLIASEGFTVSFADWTLVPPAPVQLSVYV
jgi:hypothetical protein